MTEAVTLKKQFVRALITVEVAVNDERNVLAALEHLKEVVKVSEPGVVVDGKVELVKISETGKQSRTKLGDVA